MPTLPTNLEKLGESGRYSTEDCIICGGFPRSDPELLIAIGVILALTKPMRDKLCEHHRQRLMRNVARGETLAAEMLTAQRVKERKAKTGR